MIDIYVNWVCTWFYFSPCARTEKSVNGKSIFFSWFWVKNLQNFAWFHLKSLRLWELHGKQDFCFRTRVNRNSVECWTLLLRVNYFIWIFEIRKLVEFITLPTSAKVQVHYWSSNGAQNGMTIFSNGNLQPWSCSTVRLFEVGQYLPIKKGLAPCNQISSKDQLLRLTNETRSCMLDSRAS